jgi:glycosyltransferase involved in cell wall biosynthesis
MSGSVPGIAHVISTPIGAGGAERVAGALARAALERGWRAVVLHPFAENAERSALREMSEPVLYLGRPCRHFRELPATRRWLRQKLEETRPEIIHVHLFHALALIATLRHSPKSRVLLTHHHGGVYGHSGRRLMAALDRLAGWRADYVVAVSESVRTFLIETYGYDARRIVSIPNGWENGVSDAVERAEDATVVCVANLRPEKRHDVLLRAFSQVVTRVPRARLVIVGNGPLDAVLRGMAATFGIERQVEFVGAATEVWQYLARADVFALTSSYEPGGIAVIEAMAAGVPVVASRVGGIPEVVEHGRTGELVTPGDASAFAESLIRLLLSGDLRRQMGAEARTIASRFRMEATVARYFELYAQLLGSARSMPPVHDGERRPTDQRPVHQP